MANPSNPSAGTARPDARLDEIEQTARDHSWIGEADALWLVAELRALLPAMAEREERIQRLEFDLVFERRKDHAHNAWMDGYESAMADYVAGRIAFWPKPSAAVAPAARETQETNDATA